MSSEAAETPGNSVPDSTNETRDARLPDGNRATEGEPPTQRPRTSGLPCCDCSRFSTCCRSQSGGRGNICSCKDAGRKCTNCACFDTKCRNKARPRASSTATTTAAGQQQGRGQTQRPLTCFFVSGSASSTTAATTTTRPDNNSANHGNTENDSATDDTALLTQQPAPPAQGEDDDDDAAGRGGNGGGGGDAPAEELITQQPEEAPEEDPAAAARDEEQPLAQQQPAQQQPAQEPAPIPIVTEEGADLPGYTSTEADRLLDTVYGDHPHANDGRHMDGGISDDAAFQRRWKRVAQLPTSHYKVPKGPVGKRFVKILTQELRGVRTRQWNSEKPLLFAAVILQKAEGVTGSGDIRRRLTQRMDLWDQGSYIALVDSTEKEVLGRVGPARRTKDEAAEARAFDSMVKSGRLRKAVRSITSRDGGGVLQPDDNCTKTGRPVIEVLREKHPAMRDPVLQDRLGPIPGAFEPYDSTPEPVPLIITAQIVEKVASKLSGSAGPSGTDAVDLRDWLLRFGAESEALRLEMAAWTEWLANEHPPWAAYRALMACRLMALDKEPGTRPVGIGEIYRRLMAKCVISVCGHTATAACGNVNLCAGLSAGIEGAVHAMNGEWEEDDPATALDSPRLATQDEEERAGAPMAEDEEDDDDVRVAVLLDARNGFNELGRKTMLWTVRHRWEAGARFALNCYRHAALLIVRKRGQDCEIILSQEGVTQGDPLSMHLYGIALLPMFETIRKQVPTVVNPNFADDVAAADFATRVVKVVELAKKLGPERGYFLELEKSICVPKNEEDMERAKRVLGSHNFQFRPGHRYVGGFHGSAAARDEWLEPKIEKWARDVETLAKVAVRYPQTAYAGLTKSLQPEWQYVMRVVPGIGEKFAPVEEAIATKFLPALFQAKEALPDDLRKLLALPVRSAGIGIPDPVATADGCYQASVKCTAVLTQSLRDGIDLDVTAYNVSSGQCRRRIATGRVKRGEKDLAELVSKMTPFDKRRTNRATRTGAWLTTMPNNQNGTDLSAEEFRDSLRPRYGLTPLNLPDKCDGCAQTFSVPHAMSCKKGGLIVARHDDVKYEWLHLCTTAHTPSAVSDEPFIHSSQDQAAGANGRTEVAPETRGDVAVHGFYKRGTTTVFDVLITDTDAPSNRNQNPDKILARHEKNKKDKHLEACLARRRHFTPLVFSIDGLQGTEAKAAGRRLAAKLAVKWNRSYSEVCGYVRSRLAIALVRASSRCLRGARDPTARCSHPQWDSGTGLSLYK